MRYEYFIAQRYLRSKKRTGFVSLITWISVGGVALGVIALIVVLSMVNGFEEEVRSRIVGTNAHLILLTYGDGGIADYEAVRRQVTGSPGSPARALRLRQGPPFRGGAVGRGDHQGVHLPAERSVTTVADHIDPALVDFAARPEPPIPPRAAGCRGSCWESTWRRPCARSSGTRSSWPRRSAAGSPRSESCRACAGSGCRHLHLGLYEYDASLAYISLEEAQAFFGLKDSVTGSS